MAESRILQLASTPLLTNFAIAASQRAIRKVGSFLFPLCEVPTLAFKYKTYTEAHKYKIPNSKRDLGGKATRLGFTADDSTAQLEPNALDFPIPNVGGLSDQDLGFAIQEGQSILADSAALALEYEQINLAVSTLTSGALTLDYSSNSNDPIGDASYGLDKVIMDVMKASKNGAGIKVLFGASAFRKFRNNSNVRGRFVVGSGASKGSGGVGLVSPQIGDVSNLLFGNPQVELALTVYDSAKEGLAESMSFLLDDKVIVFASNDTPNRMDPSFGKTFARMGGFFTPGTYMTEDQRDEVLKMDWTTLPKVTNSSAGKMISMS